MDYRRVDRKKQFCEGCGIELEMWEDQQCGTCKLVDALHEPQAIQPIPMESKHVAAEVK